MSTHSFGVGLIGLNHGVKLVLPALIRSSRVGDIVLAGSNSSIGKKVSIQNQDFIVRDAAELFESNSTQVILICTPPSTHVDLVARSLQSKNYVFCEKPGGIDSDEVKKIKQLSDARRTPVAFGFEYRFDPYIIFLRKYLNKIDSTKIKTVEVNWENASALSGHRQKWKQENAKGGEIVRDFLPHVIDYLALSLPDIFKFHKENRLRVQKAEIEYDEINLNFQIRNVDFKISISRRRVLPRGHRIQVLGQGLDVEILRFQPYSLDSGSILIDGNTIDIYCEKEIAEEITNIESNLNFKNNLQMYATDVLVEKFLQSCSDGDFSRVPSVQEALDNMQVIESIIDQARIMEEE